MDVNGRKKAGGRRATGFTAGSVTTSGEPLHNQPTLTSPPPTDSSTTDLEEFLKDDNFRLNDELAGGNAIYWLPKAAAQIAIGNTNMWADFDLSFANKKDKAAEKDKVAPKMAFVTNWDAAAKVETILGDRQEFGQGKKGGGEDLSEVEGGVCGFWSVEQSDEDLLALLADFHIPTSDNSLARTSDRRSKRVVDMFQEEIAARNEELKKEVQNTASQVKAFETCFEELEKLSGKMFALAESSRSRVHFLERFLVPIYAESSRHETCRKNAEEALQAIERAKSHFSAAQDYQVVIQAGPVKNLANYCRVLESIQESLRFFSHLNPPAHPQQHLLESLYKVGRENVIKEFGDLLRLHSKPIPPAMLQDAINTCLHDPSASHDFVHFAQSVHGDLQTLTQWFLASQSKKHGFYDFMDVYATFRAATVRESLDQFRVWYKEAVVLGESSFGGNMVDGDGSDLTSVGPTSTHSGGRTAGQFEGDGRSIATLPEDARDVLKSGLFKNRNKSQKNLGTPRKADESGLFQRLRKRKARGQVKRVAGVREGIDEDTYQRVEAYMVMASAFLKVIESEVGLMYGIIPEEHSRDVFDRIVRPMVERFEKEGKELGDQIMGHVSDGDFSAVLLLLQIMEHFEDLKALFATALEGCHRETIKRWNAIILIFRAAVLRTMDNFLNSIRENNNRAVPHDGTIHEITSNTIAFFSNLIDFRPLFDALILEEDKNPSGSGGGKLNFQGRNFSQYLNSVIGHLLSNLTTRAELYGDVTLKAVFMLNNLAYLFNYLQTSGVIELMKEEQGLIEQLMEEKIVSYKAAYYECWNTLLRLLSEAIAETNVLRSRGGDVQLKDKERQQLKDRCALIAKEIQTVFSKQQKYSVPDVKLRKELQERNYTLVYSLYDSYRSKYLQIPFTKFHDKYVPFGAEDMRRGLSELFSQGTLNAALNHSVDQRH